MWSLRQRAILGGLIWAGIAIAIGGVALFYFFDTLTQRRFDEALLDRYIQVVSALGNSGGEPELVESFLNDPAYQRPYSGRYWQITGADDTAVASRSLFDSLLPDHSDASAEVQFWTGTGPQSLVRGAYGLVSLEDGADWVVNVAESLSALELERQRIRQSLLTTFALIGALGVAGTILQTSAILRPLNKLREDVAHRWDRDEFLEPRDYPEEVAPLVTDINTLLERNREIVERGRRQAADLAHALKTPSAILRNELNALAECNVDVNNARSALDRVDAQLQRSLARTRAANSGASAQRQTELRTSVERLARLFRSMHDRAAKTLRFEFAPDLRVPMDMQDIEEILGNILENAFHWAKATVQLTAGRTEQEVWIRIEDDGPGIPEVDRREALRSGGRLDTSAPGTGIGLAIVADLAQAYGGAIALDASDTLGGLSVLISIPSAQGLGISG
ncbi:Virulence sensor histidine kinase PhoQ [Defluviimonas aquaemixtae]|uniref:histidine kinase n=1 Tax=Albidovulum aquaemixtae TaxID=1542388 RepID=A0A2R8BLC6_9RHOB|nr:HAMP domain-containing sensor histidine kinase [Defluviimonas aquaemixtae]SPH24233.1 Virulence sensor histidine kinase PhoQ [Defluviimonas aquaemixtae]